MKNKIKTLLLLCLSVILCMAFLTACGESNTPGDTNSEKATGNGSSSSTDDKKPDPHTHSFGEWVVTKAATCTEDGVQERNCNCGEKITKIIYATGSLGLEFTSNRDGTCYVSGIGTCKDTEIVIPMFYNDMRVTGIGDNAFYNCTSLTNITISDSITSIGRSAFYNCEGLTSLVIPDSVTSIGYEAFSTSPAYCSNLTSVMIGNGVMSIGNNAFNTCTKLVEVINKSKFDFSKGSSDHGYIAYNALEIHNGESKIVNKDDYLFYTYNGVNYLLGYCGNETKLILPEDYNGENYKIYQRAFGSSDLVSVTIGNGITSIGERAFSGCGKLVEVINKSNLKISQGSSDHGYIAYYALEIHNGESKIVNKDDYLFYTYNGINYLLGYSGNETELVLPENYNGEAYQICQYAFCKYSDLTSIVIPDSVTSIGSWAFYECRNLTSVMIGSGIKTIDDRAFRTFSRLKSIQYSGTVAQWKAISKDTDWAYSYTFNVICSDGEVLI